MDAAKRCTITVRIDAGPPQVAPSYRRKPPDTATVRIGPSLDMLKELATSGISFHFPGPEKRKLNIKPLQIS
jgi:hypothetical protein